MTVKLQQIIIRESDLLEEMAEEAVLLGFPKWRGTPESEDSLVQNL